MIFQLYLFRNYRLDGLRQDMKTCEVEINVDGLEKFMHDACNNVSGLLKGM